MDGLNQVYTAVPMGREAKATEQIRWQQLAAAVLELRKHVEALEARVRVLEPHSFVGISYGDQHVQS